MNESIGGSFDVISSVYKQLPYFACNNQILNPQSQEDIRRHIFCKEYNVPAYPGCYGGYPKRWIETVSILERAIRGKHEIASLKQKKEINANG